MSNKYEDLIKNARMNADCGEHMSPEEVTTLLNVVETTFAELAGENAGLKAFGDKLYSMYKGLETSGGGFHDEQSIPYQQAALDAAISAFEEIKTPATDAFLAEVRASGVEMFAAWNDKHINPGVEHKESLTAVSHAARGLAEQIRKGVRS
ncbi:hypothetical protein [Enterobacter roggenkampii]|uniref:hypothetical protein n=1 Tax=Enterobacter roggenkampii TaxID=1812935 RepID=UPI0018A55433|nr:hypothetical protein [Enterobacter roggenkampii]BBV94363.1 hypothetical protein STW0522ENT66_P11690 [Enterobacter roggenkampii]